MAEKKPQPEEDAKALAKVLRRKKGERPQAG